jgi:hypothetical protein
MPFKNQGFGPLTFQQRIDDAWDEMRSVLAEGEDMEKVYRKFPEFIKHVGEEMNVPHDNIKAEIQKFVAFKVGENGKANEGQSNAK